ncbi:nitroreductase family deazaflavin-dependent oxidoreductase [Plantactinospora sp. S1510]|uniref:Nitroreductase family deazaflavin-dependent oxidoreductase n=1 Tax=Plantactinospora alkalitolerans TaxID=2789879 RepID=A0ABS0HAG6_9ACTN|nr:pyridoxamine 5'-phosphate oxidase family protein [Plantactinospora alkalitolerans]MBF9135454.1 nitroreductase family deazaflavin-dependent oxidoreductase [Plantactinospora alkalitolerans]
MLPHLGTEAGIRAEQRLRDETVIWLTTVNPDGQPQTSPVGYVWDGARFLIISKPGIAKVRNLRDNPRVALHLDLDGDAEEFSVLTIEGVAELDPAPPGEPAPLREDEISGYVQKHLESMRWAGVTPEETFADFSTVIRVTPTRARSY